MYNCEKEQTSKKKIPMNTNTKNIEEKKNRDTYLLIIFSLIIGLQDIPLRNNEVLRKITRYRFHLSIYISIVFRRLHKKLSEFFLCQIHTVFKMRVHRTIIKRLQFRTS